MMQRKKFIQSVSAGVLLSHPLSILANPVESWSNPGKILVNPGQIIKPRRLKKGSKVGLISPGSFITPEELDECAKNLEALELNPVYSDRILLRDGYFAGPDEQRAADLNEMFERKDVDGIVCTRGGYGCSRILPLLNYELIRNNPKVFIGYSDVTALLFGIFKNTGLVCFHGPVGTSTLNEFSINNFKYIVMYPQDKFVMFNPEIPEKIDDELYSVNTIGSGKAKGKLIGGNLSVSLSLLGTPFDIDYDNKIVFFEDVGEEPYRIDRMLTQLIQAGKLQKAAGIALGVFDKCIPKPDESGIDNSFSLKEVLMDRLMDLNIPAVYGMSFGHIVNKFTLPFGIEAELDTLAHTITLLEPACT
ncbi:MAG TPA: LD-carboxypeptidase [Ignavibacteriaceae bacterium]|nr:LD-carboxypeptidase [Ignavibacteriaceae bacterium]